MVFNEDLMMPWDGDIEGCAGWFIVHVPGFCESEFEIAELQGTNFVSQANGEYLNQYIKAILPIEQYL